MGRRITDDMAPARVTGRDAVWAAIRALGAASAPFTRADVVAHIAAARNPRLYADRGTVRNYLQALAAAGVLLILGDAYTLTQDLGIKAPRLRPDGTVVEQGANRRALWRTIRTLKQFTADDLVKLGSTEEVQLGIVDARKYILYLAKAGYVVAIDRPGDRSKSVTWRLVPSKSTGPIPPVVRRYHSVYDANIKKEVWNDGQGECL